MDHISHASKQPIEHFKSKGKHVTGVTNYEQSNMVHLIVHKEVQSVAQVLRHDKKFKSNLYPYLILIYEPAFEILIVNDC